jgi:hypothetical protein
MPEKYVYAVCEVEDCKKIFEGQISYDGITGAATLDTRPELSPLIDILQEHHLETGITSRHNHFILFTRREDTNEEPNLDVDRTLIYSRYKKTIGFIGVTRQRNVAFTLVREPKE